MEASAPPRPRAPLRPLDRLRTSGDAELVRLVRLGHEPAFEQLYDRHHRGILSFCRHMLGSRDEAEDAVQHTFIAAYRDLRGSDKPIHLKAWLYTIARNRCLSMLRARREQVALDDVEPATEGLAAEVQRRQDLRDMLRDLHRLPEDQRAALVLSELGALSHEEIAMTLHVRKDKVKALVFQARESLASSRQARNADCQEIQKQLSILRGGSLRRTTLRRHVEVCPACRAFKDEVQRQRAAMAIILPVVPTSGLKAGVLSSALGAGGAGLGAGAGGALVAGGGISTKLIVGAVLIGGGLGGGILAVDELRSPPSSSADEARKGDSATRVIGFPGAGQRDAAGRPAEGDAAKVVGLLRDRAAGVARERAAQKPVPTRWGLAGEKTIPAAVVNVVAGALGELGGADEAKQKPADDGDKPGNGPKPKKAKKPKIPQHFGAQGKGNAYGRGREPAAGNGPSGTGTPGAAARPKAQGGPPAAKPKPRRRIPGGRTQNMTPPSATHVLPAPPADTKEKRTKPTRPETAGPKPRTPTTPPPGGNANGQDKPERPNDDAGNKARATVEYAMTLADDPVGAAPAVAALAFVAPL